MSTRRAFTLIELAAAIAATGSLLALVAQPLADARQAARKSKDATQVRGIHQSFIVFSSNNKDEFPLPSKLDRVNATVAAAGRAKDTTANIYSMCIFAGMIPAELLISPSEVNRSIRVINDYQFDAPKSAVKPASALWDPAFSVDFTAGKGHASYAHLQPAGDRLNRWAATFNADEPVLTLRGPEVAKVDRGAATPAGTPVTPTLANRDSNTLKIFGEGKAWAGNVAMADNSVHFITRYAAGETLTPERSPVYTTKDNTKVVDLWNHDEQDDPASTNNMLGIFTTAGDKPADYKVIWD
jgi:hypothetical protein